MHLTAATLQVTPAHQVFLQPQPQSQPPGPVRPVASLEALHFSQVASLH